MVERYHDPLRKIFSIIQWENPRLDLELALQCAVKRINNAVESYGLIPSLSVFGVIPTFPAFNPGLPSQKERMSALASARSEMTSITGRLRIQQALHSRLPPSTEYIVYPGDMLFVFREPQKQLNGPYKVLKVSANEVCV